MDREASLRPRCTALLCILLSSPRLPVTMVVNTICCLFNKILYRIYLPHLDASVQYWPPLCRTTDIRTVLSYRTFHTVFTHRYLAFPSHKYCTEKNIFQCFLFSNKTNSVLCVPKQQFSSLDSYKTQNFMQKRLGSSSKQA